MNVLNYLRRPEYIFRPKQVFRKFRMMMNPPKEVELVELPWGMPVHAHLNENIGAAIIYYGIFDKIVPETIWRLMDPGETGFDVGANIGQNASAMAYRAGRNGRVVAFEPHPAIFVELSSNVKLWPENIKGRMNLEQVALSDKPGRSKFVEGSEWAYNRGHAKLSNSANDSSGFDVEVRTLDEYVSRFGKVGVCKIDVEGHELSVLKGAESAFENHAIRDVIFEDFNDQPSAISNLLASNGFTIFELHERWSGPFVSSQRIGAAEKRQGFSFNFLATLEPRRAADRFRQRRWKCLTG